MPSNTYYDHLRDQYFDEKQRFLQEMQMQQARQMQNAYLSYPPSEVEKSVCKKPTNPEPNPVLLLLE